MITVIALPVVFVDHAVHRTNQDEAREECGRCWRPVRSCICSALTAQLYCNCRVRIMILQHPRCQVSIGTIRILKTTFKYCQIVIGKDFKAGRSLGKATCHAGYRQSSINSVEKG